MVKLGNFFQPNPDTSLTDPTLAEDYVRIPFLGCPFVYFVVDLSSDCQISWKTCHKLTTTHITLFTELAQFISQEGENQN